MSRGEAAHAIRAELESVSARLEREATLLRAVVDQVPVGIVVTWGPEHRYLLVNDRGRQMIPPVGELIGRTLAEVFADQPEVVSLGRQILGNVFESGVPSRFDELAVPFGGPEALDGNRYYDLSITPIHEDGAVAGILNVYVEVTEKVRRQRSLQAQLEHEQEVARLLQRSLLPDSVPQTPEVAFASAYRPGRSGELVGGDFFDVIRWTDRWLMVLGDVQGKGVQAAGTMALIRHSLRGALLHRTTLAGLLEDLNRILLDDTSPARGALCTAALAALDVDTGRLEVALAGHPPPVLVTAEGDVDTAFPPGILLGAAEGPAFTTVSRTMRPGDLLLLYSDGLPDAQAPSRFIDVAAEARAACAGGMSPQGLVDALCGVALSGPPPRDDLTLLAAQLLPAPVGAATA